MRIPNEVTMNAADVRKFQRAYFERNYSRGSLKVAIARRAYRDAKGE